MTIPKSPAVLPAFPFGVHLSSLHPSHLVSIFLCIHTVFLLLFALTLYSSASLSSPLPSCLSSIESRGKTIFPSPPIQGKGPCIISRLRHPSFYLLRLQTPSRAAANNFTHPRRLRTSVSSSTTFSPSPHICLIFDDVSFPGGPTVSAHS